MFFILEMKGNVPIPQSQLSWKEVFFQMMGEKFMSNKEIN